MFLLSVIRDIVKLEARQFNSKSLFHVVKDYIENKYSGKVLPSVGIGIGLWDILSVGDPIVEIGVSYSCIKIEFRLIVFRPFIGEIISGKVLKSNSEGIQIGLGFFNDIYLPPNCLPSPAEFDEEEKLWIWNYEGNKLYFEIGSEIRVKVESVEFHQAKCIKDNAEEEANEDSPIVIMCSASESGLGLLQWWHKEAEEEEEKEYEKLVAEQERIEKMKKEAEKLEKRNQKRKFKKGKGKKNKNTDGNEDVNMDGLDEDNELVYAQNDNADDDFGIQDDE